MSNILLIIFLLLFTENLNIAQNNEQNPALFSGYDNNDFLTKYGAGLMPLYLKEIDTINLNFYPEFPKDYTLTKWLPNPYDSGGFYFSKIIRIKNNFSHDIYLKSIKTGAGYCVPGGMYSGIIKPGEEAYSSIFLRLNGKNQVSRGVGFYFIFCPGTEAAEQHFVEVHFKGKRFPEKEKEKK